MQNYQVLVIDDDPNIGQLIRIYLEKEGYGVKHYLNGLEGLNAFKKHQYHIVVLDIMLPGIDGWEVCREIRKFSDVPIIMLTAKGEVFDKVLGLELGADDYIVKPFEPKELLARTRAVMRRYKGGVDVDKKASYKNLTVSIDDYSVNYCGSPLELPPKELELLYFLATHPNRVFTREQLLEQVWSFDYYGDSRTVDVHIKRLREKLNEHNDTWQIKTVWGVGYKFEVK
jgi:DNA-binding response OmpR family regulator